MAERGAGSLRIALLAPIAGPVGPESPSSIEQLVSLLAEEFVRRGHTVTLFATGDSTTSAELAARYPRGYEHDGDLWNWEFHEVMQAAAACERAADFDVIHTHGYHYTLPFTRLVRTPILHTYHVVANPDVRRVYAAYPEARLIAVSHYHRATFAGAPNVAVVYNGVDVAAFPFGPTGGDYLLYLGHLIPRKGPLEAIRVARASGMRLLMAGGRGGEYFRTMVKPRIDGRLVEHLGPVGVRERNALLAGAAALVFTSQENEPFGLVLIEAMACGTPVVALDRCAVPEIVEPNVTGLIAADADLLAAQLPRALALDRAGVRQAVAARFDHRRMADAYEALYRRAIWGEAAA